ncbi:hypothetical protein K2P97_01395 [bacterium]|nr:hypothetical protein [bacterium]
MSNKVTWIFYDTFAKTQSNPFSQEDAQTAILKMRPQDVARFLIWSAGWASWQPLKTYLESDQKNFVSTFTVPIPMTGEQTVKATIKEVLENTQTQYRTKEDTKSYSSIKLTEETVSRIVKQDKQPEGKSFDGDDITWSGIEKPNLDFSKISQAMHRRETRHELKIEILLISPKGKSFRSRSKNISLSGSLLEDTIPFDYYDTPFDVVVINNHTKDPQKSRVKLQATTVGGNGLTQRIHYHNPTDLQKKALQILLEDYIALQNKSKKTG